MTWFGFHPGLIALRLMHLVTQRMKNKKSKDFILKRLPSPLRLFEK